MPDYCDELETRDPTLRERRHFLELPKQIAQASKAPGWAAHLKGIDPRAVASREALAKLPVMRKADIADLQKQNPPFGGLNTKPAGTFGRLLMSPGPIFEPQAEGPGEGRLRPARVRAGMMAAIAEGGAQRFAGASADGGRAGRGERCRQAGRGPVGHVVKARGGPAEPLVSRRPVPHHRVQRVHRAVGGQAGQPGNRGPDQRGDRRVAGVLGHRLHHRASDVLRSQADRVTAAESREHLAGRSQIVRIKGHGGPFGNMTKRTGTGDRPDGGRDGCGAGQRPATGEAVRGHRRQAGTQHAGAGVQRAAQPVIRVAAGLQPRGGAAEGRHRVPAARVSDQRVQCHARGQASRQRPVPARALLEQSSPGRAALERRPAASRHRVPPGTTGCLSLARHSYRP